MSRSSRNDAHSRVPPTRKNRSGDRQIPEATSGTVSAARARIESVPAAAGGLHIVVDEPSEVRIRFIGGIVESSSGGRFGTHHGGPKLDQPLETFVFRVIEVGHRNVER